MELFKQEKNGQCIKLDIQEVMKSKDNVNVRINLNV